MKKILFTCICILLCTTSLADEQTENHENNVQEVAMNMQEQRTGVTDRIHPGQHKSLARMPRVAYDLQYIYITPYYDIADAQIIIRDETDNIIYDIYTSLTGTGSVIMLSKEVMENKYCIEIIFSGKSYIGYF